MMGKINGVGGMPSQEGAEVAGRMKVRVGFGVRCRNTGEKGKWVACGFKVACERKGWVHDFFFSFFVFLFSLFFLSFLTFLKAKI